MSDTVFEGERFGFTVEAVTRDHDGRGLVTAVPFREQPIRVYLPHQCDEWGIAGDGIFASRYGDDYDPVADMAAFIAEAQNAYAALVLAVEARLSVTKGKGN